MKSNGTSSLLAVAQEKLTSEVQVEAARIYWKDFLNS